MSENRHSDPESTIMLLLNEIKNVVHAALGSGGHCATKEDLRQTERRITKLLNTAHFDYSIEVRQKKSNNSMPLKIKINDEQKVNVKLVPVTPRGKPVKVDGIPEWTVNDGDSKIVVAADGLSADLISADVPGVTDITVSADVDLGEGVDTISDTIELTVVNPQANSLGLVASPAVDKDAPAPTTP
jgi:hypothetical protein